MTEAYCPACRRVSEAFLPNGERPQARCPECQSVERNRFSALLFDLLAPYLRDAGRVLEVAPTPILRRLLEARFGGTRYVGTDLFGDREVDVRSDLGRLPFADGSFDLVLCSHVLEHVADDRAAMRELARVCAPTGIVVVFIPYRDDEPTDEGPLRPGETAEERFGQDDHVRWYGVDFDERLAEEGLPSFQLQPSELFTAEEIERFRLVPDERCWVCLPAPSPAGPALVTQLLRGRAADRRAAGLLELGPQTRLRTFETLRERAERSFALEQRAAGAEGRIAALTEERDRLRERAEHAEALYRQLAAHPVVRTLRGVRSRLRRGKG